MLDCWRRSPFTKGGKQKWSVWYGVQDILSELSRLISVLRPLTSAQKPLTSDMSDSVITVENLSKRYIIGHQMNRHDGLRHQIEAALRNPWRWLGARSKEREVASEEFWALKDVSFEVKRGEVVGIIGRNGAGKSTLLKVLSRITEPTQGRIRLQGRVASLLEVGTGFHPELTGRENIFLNGAILGMSEVEIKRKFDEIVAFSEIEQFLDTPVKRYSSGMYVRLAFAVAAHLQPEILIVDEVLAVGDAAFQKKCLGKMQAVSGNEGRSVLFVSHNMQAIRQLCGRLVLLDQGRVAYAGSVYEGTSAYLGQKAAHHRASIELANYPRSCEPDRAKLLRIEFFDERGRVLGQCSRESDLMVVVSFRVMQTVAALDIPMAVVHVEGQRVFSEKYSDQMQKAPLAPGDYTVRFTLPLRFLKLESYFLVVGLYESGRHCDLVEGLPMPELRDAHCDPHAESQRWGVVRIPVAWSVVEPLHQGSGANGCPASVENGPFRKPSQ
jgi:lipopolysaccharide transport system ATP-binding protein